jgi:hypothetical protein
MEKVKQVHADGLGSVKERHGVLDRGTEGRRMDRGRQTLGYVDKQVYMRWSIDSIDRSQDYG